MKTCSACGGIGEVQDMEVRQHGRYAMQWARCSDCSGTGRIEAPEPNAPVTVPAERRARAFDGPLTGQVRAGWASKTPRSPYLLEVA